jgi:OmcA/MtrC family decaheme c-type cytochrome
MHRVSACALAIAVLLVSGCDDDESPRRVPVAGSNGPGLTLQIRSVEVPPPPGAPVVTFRATDEAGVPLDLVNELVRGRITQPRFTLAMLQPTGDYRSYYETNAAARAFTPPGGTTPVPPGTPPRTATQATSVRIPATGEGLEALGDGVYRFSLGAPSVSTGLDPARTHTAGMWATRTVDGVGDAAASTFNFVPAGGAPERHDVVANAACNACHGVVEAHDERTDVQLCITCHSPQSSDPETGNTVDMKVMIHKIHRGANLTQKPYFIAGFGQPSPTIHDYSEIGFPQDIRNCTACHQGEDSPRFLNANVASCTACHDYLRFTDTAAAPDACLVGTSETAACNHRVPVASTAACGSCHGPSREASLTPGVAVPVVHDLPELRARANYQYLVDDIASAAPGQNPTVRFRVVNAAGQAYALTEEAFPANALRLQIGFMRGGEVTNEGSGRVAGQPVQMTVTAGGGALGAGVVANGDGSFTATSPVPVPAGADAVVALLEGHPVESGVNVPVTNAVRYETVGGADTARRKVVALEKCDACHGVLRAHGDNRNESIDSCTVCHNPRATDLNRSAFVAAGAADDTPIDFKWMIHTIHAREIRGTAVTIQGFGTPPFGNPPTPHLFPLHFPRGIGDCAVCHEGETYTLPLAAIPPDAYDTTFDWAPTPDADRTVPNPNPAGTPASVVVTNPATSDTQPPDRVPAAVAVCTSCHDQVRLVQPTAGPSLPICEGPNAAADGTAPCLHSGGPVGTTTSCAACHREGGNTPVSRTHAVGAAR